MSVGIFRKKKWEISVKKKKKRVLQNMEIGEIKWVNFQITF